MSMNPMDGSYSGLPAQKQQLLQRIDLHQLPLSYRQNSAKEETELEYVENFRRQFVQIFPKRPELLLCPVNEAGVRKFVCSTIRPSNLSSDDVYDLRSAASFVADFFDYLPLQNSTHLSDLLPSPSTVLQLRAGDCLDLSVVLCSLLRGVGYDAYVVAGQAPLWVTQCDQSAVDFDPVARRQIIEEIRPDGSGVPRFGSSLLPPAVGEESEVKAAKYQFKTKAVRESKFLAMEKEAALVEAEKQRLRAIAEADEQARASREPLYGQRAHCWVLVRASETRNLPSDVFVEPSTGVVYPVAASPYLGVDAVWNERNYWVNVQQLPPDDINTRLSLNLRDTLSWEYVLIEPRRGDVEEEEMDAQDMEAAAATADGKELLDQPSSWCSELHVPRELMIQRFPDGGYRRLVFHKCMYERWAPHHARGDGMVCSLKLFSDEQMRREFEVHEYYSDRRDGLQQRRIYPVEGRIHCQYEAGRARGLKDWIEYGDPASSAQALIDNESSKRRVFDFYPGARVDGLVKREEQIGHKVMDHFQGRDDNLSYRSATVDDSHSAMSHASGGMSAEFGAATSGVARREKVTIVQIGGVDLPLRKFAEKFQRNTAVHAEEDVAKISYLLTESQIRLDYHRGADRVTASRRVYAKETSDATGWCVDALYKAPGRSALRADLQSMLAREKDTLGKVREHERAMHDMLQQLRRELTDVTLQKSIYDLARQKANEEDKVANGSDGEADDQRAVDVLAPYLQQFGQVTRLSYEQAKRARDECLKALRDRLLERAAIIQSRLDEENDKLQKKQQSYQRQGHGEQEDEEMSRYYENAIFKIHILQARIQRHDETALKKYTELEQTLRKDNRLRALYA